MPSQLQEFYDIEEKRLRGKLDGVRLVISHPGEKGRVLENEVSALIKNMLPLEYGLSTGFVAYRKDGDVDLSPQLDIIIYDALRCSPLVSYETCAIFPLEAVYSYIEVKARLDATSLANILKVNRALRRLRQRWFWSVETGSPPSIYSGPMSWLAVRSFVFSFESNLGTGPDLAKKLQCQLHAAKAHLHGVFIGDQGLFSPHIHHHDELADDAEFAFTDAHPLSNFKVLLLKCLATFPRCPINCSPAVDRYHYDFVELAEGI